MATYYNEFDPVAAARLRELMADGLIPEGEVDERSIAEVQPEDLAGYVQCHFFAGIGGWPLALRLAGWPDDWPCWTGSCPCQPFSEAGKRLGAADERDLWPEFFRLVQACRPPKVWGEQVASSEVVGSQSEAAFLVAVQAGDFARANKLAKQLAQSRSFHFHPRWLTRVRADLATADYSLWWSVLGAHSVGAPHIRQRLYWVAKSDAIRHDRREDSTRPRQPEQHHETEAGDERVEWRAGTNGRSVASGCGVGGLVYSGGTGSQGYSGDGDDGNEPGRDGAEQAGSTPAASGVDWSDSRIIVCRDGKARRIPASAESVLFGVADGLPGGVDPVRLASAGFPLAGKTPNRVGLLRGYGNAIVPQVAAAFIEAFMEAT